MAVQNNRSLLQGPVKRAKPASPPKPSPAAPATPADQHTLQATPYTPSHIAKATQRTATNPIRTGNQFDLLIDGKQVYSAIDKMLSGVKVTAILPKEGDSGIIDAMHQKVVNELLAAGVKTYLFNTDTPAIKDACIEQQYFNHGKVATVDGVWTAVGTANADTRSMEMSQEINFHIDSPDFAQEVESRVFAKDLSTRCEPAKPTTFTKIGKPLRDALDVLRPWF